MSISPVYAAGMYRANVRCLQSFVVINCNRTGAHSPMKKSALLLALAATAALPAYADLALATSKNCMACHAVDRKVIGPSFKDVAAKYKDDAGAPDRLAKKIISGGAGVWGPIPMPANTQVSEADAKKLASWILQTK